MVKYNILSTKKLDPLLIEKANANHVDIVEQQAIQINPVLTREQLKEIEFLFKGSQPKHIIFTSSNAVEIVAGHLQDCVLSPSNWKVFCIEGKTKESVQSSWNDVEILETAAYGKILATKILNHHIKEAYFFCGNIRRDELPEILKKAGIQLYETVVYETILHPIKIEGEYDAILFFSASAVESYFSMNKINAGTICFSIGETTSSAIRNFTRNNIITSQVPTQEKMIEEVLNHFCVHP